MSEVYEKYVKEFLDDYDNLTKIEFNIPKNFNFAHNILDELANKNSDDLALIWCDLYNNKVSFTFKQISILSNKAANLFKARGVKKGDFVLLILKRHYAFWIILMALHKIGAIAIPATHMLTVDDLAYRIKFAKIKTIVFITQNGVFEKIMSVKKMCPNLKQLIYVGEKTKILENEFNFFENLNKYSNNFVKTEVNVNDNMLAYFTSGTTGLPKLVVHNYAYPVAHLITAKYWQKAKAKQLHLTVSDTGWGKAVWGKLYGQWMVRAPVMVYDFDKFVADDLLNIIEKFQVKTFCAPSTIYRFFIKKAINFHNLSSLRYVTTAGEALETNIIYEFKKRTNLTIVAAFGQTETTAVLMSQNINHKKINSIGKPSPLYDVVLINDNKIISKSGQIGEICIKLKNKTFQIGLFNKYYNDEQLTQFVHRNGFYHTGDLAYFDEEGYYYYVSRIDDIIKSSGYRIGPFEIESVLIEHPAVLECAVVGVNDEIRGQIIKAFIILNNMFKPSVKLAEEIKNFVKQKTAPYKYPRMVEFVKVLPKTISGKVQRKILQKLN